MESKRIDLGLMKAFAEAARADMESAKVELDAGSFHNSVYHAQQAAEKICKALLIGHNKFEATHIVSPIFEKVRLAEKLPGELIYAVKDLEKSWLITRYPFRTGKEIWSPVSAYTKKDAEGAIEKARIVFSSVSKHLKEKYGINA